ncbi:MAG: shikimate dehydrogenase [Candidatus Brocadiaceae bacterium]|nr:shikimate dehydrogenase [Candidatus Brocadiaceae bacterium]
MICIPIIANNLDDALRDMAEASKFADIIEVRLDYIKNPDLKRILQRRTKPLIITNRPDREGGRFNGSEEERIAVLKHAIQLQADFVDIEHDSIHNLCRDTGLHVPSSKTKFIVSYHNFRETPDDLISLYQRLSQSDADTIKIVTHANSITDNIKIYRLLQQARRPLISFCMGEYGIISRILYKRFGSYLTFASLRKGKESAPGQITIQEFLLTYQAQRQEKDTGIYGLIGNPVSHSISPMIHNTLFKEMNFNSIYVPFKVDNIDDFFRSFKELDVKGYSVTIPHKESVIHHLDAIDPVAKKIGAVNTIVNKDSKFIGYNTDCKAAIQALEDIHQVSGMDPKNDHLKDKRITLLGAGGAARAIAFGLQDRGAQVTIVSRNYERAQSLSRDVGCSSKELKDLQRIETDILINATPVGMLPAVNETPIDKKLLKPSTIVFDTIYNPIETRLLREAKAQGCKIVGGLPMFVNQAAAQFELWTGMKPSRALIEDIAYKKLLGE